MKKDDEKAEEEKQPDDEKKRERMAIHCEAIRELPGHLRREAKAGVHDILHNDASTYAVPPKPKRKATATAKALAETLDAWIKKATATETPKTAATAADAADSAAERTAS